MEAAEELVRRLKCWLEPVVPVRIKGGITNANFLVEHQGKKYFVRIGDDIPVHQVMRFNELAAGRAAAECGLSPQVVYFERGALVFDFIEAKTFAAADVRRLSDALDPDAFTIGFARRFATYKRATLLFRDVTRLKKLLTNPDMPVQIVIAGKAHPKDHPGKTLIREIVHLSRDPSLSKRLVFLEDYGIEVARDMVRLLDLEEVRLA